MTERSFIIIGGGLSGLAAGIRLSQYGHRVTIFERHTVPGGLNSYYERSGRMIDTGLHAMTNISTAENHGAPLNLLLRQLRIRRSELELCPQERSSIEFPEHKLVFTNDIEFLRAQVKEQFPADTEHFDAFIEEMKQFNPFVTDGCFMPTLSVLEQRFVSPVLRDMLCCAVMYYGNAMEHDMDYRQFCIIFRSIFLEGLGRPKNGIKAVIDLLCKRLQANGAALRLGLGIASIEHDGTKVLGVVDTHGERHIADDYLSCAGGPETGMLLSTPLPGLSDLSCGRMSFLENVFELNCPPTDLGFVDGITFKNFQSRFVYEPVQNDTKWDSVIICVPANFNGVSSREVRVSLQTSSEYWNRLSAEDYKAEKIRHGKRIMMLMDELHPGFANAVVSSELFTPKTITRFTKRLNGAIYGMPDKCWDALTPLANLKLIGADQGYLGIVGALLSGVAVSNRLL